jgi:reverse gyrase
MTPRAWLPDDEYEKAVGQLRQHVNVLLMETFNKHGYDALVPGTTKEIVKLAEDFGLRIRGVDKPISIEYVRRKKKGKK